VQQPSQGPVLLEMTTQIAKPRKTRRRKKKSKGGAKGKTITISPGSGKNSVILDGAAKRIYGNQSSKDQTKFAKIAPEILKSTGKKIVTKSDAKLIVDILHDRNPLLKKTGAVKIPKKIRRRSSTEQSQLARRLAHNKGRKKTIERDFRVAKNILQKM
jgi:hypothetical protein